jgi:hypothetical protein
MAIDIEESDPIDLRRAEQRLRRLNAASRRRPVEPDTAPELSGAIGDGQVIADDLLSVAGLGLDLTPEQRRVLSREEVASMLTAGVQFEAVLMAGFGLEIAGRSDAADLRSTYALYEVGEETRHSRLFLDVVRQIGPRARNPLDTPWLRPIGERITRFVIRRPATFYTLVLGGEEIPDMLQRLATEHPDTDPHLAAVNRYHRMEEARHLSFARLRVAEVWPSASPVDRWSVGHVAPLLIENLWDLLVHPGVYETVGLPGWDTWRAVRVDPLRVRRRHDACRPVLAALLDAGVLRSGRVPRGWRRLCGVDRHGRPAA